MTPEETELAKQIAAHPAWEWRPGMRIFTPEPCRLFSPDDYAALCPSPNLDDNEVGIILGGDVSVAKGCHWPDLSDPATQGVLLAMVVAMGWRVGPVAEEEGPHNGKYAHWRQKPFRIWKDVDSYGAALAAAWLAAHGDAHG